MTITEFLLARIAEDEQTAKLECEAKRQIVKKAIEYERDRLERLGTERSSVAVSGMAAAMWETCTFLAAAYASHEDFRGEWVGFR